VVGQKLVPQKATIPCMSAWCRLYTLTYQAGEKAVFAVLALAMIEYVHR
jgi:hypothetical protein